MGVLTDFVVADRNDAQRICESTCPSQDFGGLDAKGIDTTKLGSLHALLTGGEFDPSFMGKDFLCSGGENGPWILEVPADLVKRLASLKGRELNLLAAKWAATEELSPKYENWPPEAVRQVLEQLAGLCRRSVTERKAVLMWMCL